MTSPRDATPRGQVAADAGRGHDHDHGHDGGDWRLVLRLLRYLRHHRRLFVAALLLYPLDAATVALPPYLVRRMIDDALPTRDVGLLRLLGGVYLLALVVEYTSGFWSQYVMSVLGQRAMRALRADVFAHVQRLPAAFFDRNPIGRVLTRVSNDVESLAEVFATGAVTVIADLITVAAIVGMMVWLDARLTLFSFLVVPPLIAVAIGFQRVARRAFRAIRRHLARLNGFLAEHIAGMGAVQVFGQQDRTQREFEALGRQYRDANRDAILFDALLFSIVEAISTAAVAVLIWLGAVDMTTGVVGAGTLVAFIQYIRRFFVPIRDLSTKYTILQSAFAASERIFELLDEDVVIRSPADAQRLVKIHEGLALRDVWFAYRNPPSERDWVLRDINLQVRRGERIALVGATGSGKTTIVRLLNRFYDVQRGAVLVDGIDVRQLELTALRRLFAVVLQDVHLFSGTVMQNLAFADCVTAAGVRRAVRAVDAEAMMLRLPHGFDTRVEELGANFSAGERQLLALARALAFDPEVIVLDEATSNIDSETEARIQSALELLWRDRTAIVVAHRLSTIRKVDRIVVLQAGRIAEEGNHDTLMQRGGLYRTLVEVQFAGGTAA